LQIELVKLQEWIRHKELKVVVIFEGRDAAGKGGCIKRITQSLSPRVCPVVALPAPTEREKSQWYFQRYVQHLPAAGEMVLLDRSWYNRAGVERVMRFCTEDEHHEFLRSCPEFERMLVRSGIILIKYWFSSAMMAFGLFITNTTRLYCWYTPGIWKVPLLWSLFLSLIFIDIGFLLFALTLFTPISKFIAIHAFAFGGIGIITLSMMSRVSLGHTGRNINEPSVFIKYALIIFSFGAVVRVFFPLINNEYYLSWIVISQLCWITSFLLFTIVYAPILTQARIDGQPD